MALYTITINTLQENNFDFGLNTYPIFDENYRSILNNKILNHYFMDEIGFETPALFKKALNIKMNEIMPYYNKLYEKQTDLYTYLESNVNLTEQLQRTNKTTTESNTNSSSDSIGKSVYQATPQGSIKMSDVDDFKYATNVTTNKNDINDNTSQNGTADNTENYVKTIIGSNGQKYGYEVFNNLKNAIIDIDLLIIKDLEDLFMEIM